MTETAERTDTTNEQDTGGDGTSTQPSDRLRQAAQALLHALGDRTVGAAVDQVEGLAGRLTDVAESGGNGLSGLLGGGGGDDDGGGGGLTGALASGASSLKDKVTGALGMGGGDSDDADDAGGGGGGGDGGGGRGKFKFLNIFEAQDVGVPLRVAYDQWTQFADFPSFMKKVENVDQSSDEKVTWKAQVFWSHRTWDTTIVEQIPDSHILWTSSGAKGHADGIVTFSELAPNLTRIILVLEYYPQGFMEKTGNLWRAVGRRARLEFKHFCRFVMMDTLLERDELEGWRGEIRDSEVVKTHEEAMEEEQAAAEDAGDEPSDDDLEPSDDEAQDLDEESDEDDDLDETDDVDETDDLDETDDAEDADEGEDEPDDDVDEAEDVDDADDVGDAEDDDATDEEPEPRRPRRRQRTMA